MCKHDWLLHHHAMMVCMKPSVHTLRARICKLSTLILLSGLNLDNDGTNSILSGSDLPMAVLDSISRARRSRGHFLGQISAPGAGSEELGKWNPK